MNSPITWKVLLVTTEINIALTKLISASSCILQTLITTTFVLAFEDPFLMLEKTGVHWCKKCKGLHGRVYDTSEGINNVYGKFKNMGRVIADITLNDLMNK